MAWIRNRIALEASDGRTVDEALRVLEAAVEAGEQKAAAARRPGSAEPWPN
jgi:alkyl hydroperoxide reductase subunit AhpC